MHDKRVDSAVKGRETHGKRQKFRNTLVVEICHDSFRRLQFRVNPNMISREFLVKLYIQLYLNRDFKGLVCRSFVICR